MRMNFIISVHRFKIIFISSLLTFLCFWLQFRNVDSFHSFYNLSDIQTINLSPNEQSLNVNVTYLGAEIIYKVFKKYNFFVPNVDVVCQCSCTEEKIRSCSLDDACARLTNSTTSCTIHIIIDTEWSMCSKFYKLCCQAYFTKSKIMHPFTSVYLKHHHTLLKFRLFSKSFDDQLTVHDITLAETVKTLLVYPDNVLDISEIIPEQPIPETWYFIEDGTDELKYCDGINDIDERNMNKIGWFYYSVQQQQLSRVSLWDLKKHLKVQLSDCHSNPPKYEWKLNSTYYISKGLLHLPENVLKASELNKEISKISVNPKEWKVKVEVNNPPNANVMFKNVNLYPFIFASSIKENYLNLTFTRGNGSFYAEISSPHWADIVSFFITLTVNIIKLPSQNYDSCWVCVYQNEQQLCQIPNLIKNDESQVTLSTIGLNNNSQISVINSKGFQNETDFLGNTNSSASVKGYNNVVVIATTVSVFILLASLILIVILLRRKRRSIRRKVHDEEEMKPLSSNRRSTRSSSFIMKYFHRNTSSEIHLLIAENQINVYKDIELPQIIWTDRILPLEELYIQLELFKTDGDCEGNQRELMQLEDLFNQINGKDPLRILIEGGAGYGKTTLCCKLINDWGRNRPYIRSKFKMVFLFELRHFKENDSIEEMLKSECEEIGVNGDDGINCIETYENETLLILDGFDEMNDEGKRKIIPLIQTKKYPSMFVLVTSRRGMFQMTEKKGINELGIIKKTREDVQVKHIWNKRILIKGVTADKIEAFMIQYVNKDYRDFESIIQTVIRGEMMVVFECPLLLILLAMMLEEKAIENITSKTTLYKEFFSFISRRNLIRDNKKSQEEEINMFSQSNVHSELFQSLDRFGRLAIECLCENKLMFEENEVLQHCKHNMIFHLGFLTKIPKMQGRRKETFYQPIHKSFLEFVAAFAMFNLFQADENRFKIEIERIGQKGLKPTNDSLFYVFLGGFMNDKAYVLFHCLTRYALWFNIESICFTNILLEIKNIYPFFSSFQTILDLFVPPLYSIDESKGLTEDYYQSEIHSLILKHSSDRQLMKLLRWDSDYCFNLSNDLHVERIHFYFTEEIFNIFIKESRTSIKCKSIVYEFPDFFNRNKWNNFVSVFNSIQSEKVHFFLGPKVNKINSFVLYLLHKELIEGQWKEKNIDRMKFELNESDDLHSLSLFVDLVIKNRINEGAHLWIDQVDGRTEQEISFLNSKTEELFHAVMQSTTIKDFLIRNDESKFFPRFNFDLFINPQLKSLYFEGLVNLVNSNEKKLGKKSVEIVRFPFSDNQTDLCFMQNLHDIKYLECSLIYFNSLVEMKCSRLNEITELELGIPSSKQFHLLNSVLQLRNLQVLTLDVQLIVTIPQDFKLYFINFFSLLNLSICQFIWIQNPELFSFFTEVLKEGLKKKKTEQMNSLKYSNEESKFQLQELVILFYKKETDLNELKECDGIQFIHSMLRNKQIQQFSLVDYYNYINFDQLMSLFPPRENFRITYEVNGMNPMHSGQSKFDHRWFTYDDRCCIKFCNE